MCVRGHLCKVNVNWECRFAAELHLVHVADDGSVSVVAILFDYGHPDPLLAKVNLGLTYIPSDKYLYL